MNLDLNFKFLLVYLSNKRRALLKKAAETETANHLELIFNYYYLTCGLLFKKQSAGRLCIVERRGTVV